MTETWVARCWRVGVDVEQVEGQRCPECGDPEGHRCNAVEPKKKLPNGKIDISHAVVMPWPASNLYTWCGHSIDSEAIKDQFIASSPDAVTCPRCAEAMKDALKNLTVWVPKLTS